MKNFFKRFVRTRCDVIVDRDRISDVLVVLDQHEINDRLSIGSCEWGDASSKWYIMFTANGVQLDSIEDTLKNGNFNEILILKNVDSWIKVEQLSKKTES